MSVRVSVVVPVYNPGRYLDACIDSLLRQSLAPQDFEAIFVDDGSTDGSAQRLDRLAADLDNVHVTHIPNSGWPGRPRNVGLGAATGKYVLFLDHDDWLGDEALERLAATADRTGAEVVVGREVGHGRGVPLELFRNNVDEATLERDPLLRLLTPHKLFRREMLEEHDIRFPEGRRRFEDHVFVMRAYFAAQRISIMADYPCYHWVTREGRANASDEYADPRSYYADLRDVLDIVDANTEPGAFRDRLTAHWYRRRCLDRLRGERWADGPAAHDLEVFDAVRALALERIGPGVDAVLPLSHRLRSAAVRANRPDLVTRLASVENGAHARVSVKRLEREAEWLRVQVAADIVDASGRAMRFTRMGDHLHWRPPDDLDGVWSDADADADVDAEADLEASVVSVVLAQAAVGLQHDAPAVIERVVRETDDGPVLSILARAEIDLRRVATGRPLDPGAWELFVDVDSCGWHSRRRLPALRLPGSAVPVHFAVGAGGGIGLVVGDPAGIEVAAPAVRRQRASRHPVERLVPRRLLALVPHRLRQAGKRLLLRL
jgi:poly(ribitol-phosphate) beta-N-acetylglucosaminyltransferase